MQKGNCDLLQFQKVSDPVALENRWWTPPLSRVGPGNSAGAFFLLTDYDRSKVTKSAICKQASHFARPMKPSPAEIQRIPQSMLGSFPAIILAAMKILFLIITLLFLFAGGGFCLGGTGGGVGGLILLDCVCLHFTGGFRRQSKPPTTTLSHSKRSGLRDEGLVPS